ncbi:hypothetical protein SmJEL517_g01636 [Synchytrium microbalum]|uniref:TPR-like protein n=1 Tax=Synchytrium microbalum TaxID=1806994 RepID=A0A507CFG3_9FUNG|nr:uncharacterized protein SmJEL517_g01636 [Synchytrium microbalum]TPX36325.1 hypothetical protein SmJEL517_g01636 [Synchytrium microbalum]
MQRTFARQLLLAAQRQRPVLSTSRAPRRIDSKTSKIEFSSTSYYRASISPTISLDPQTELAKEWFEKGARAWQEGDLENALDCYEKSAWSKPTADAYFNAGNVLHSMGQHDKAIDAWKRSLNLDDKRPDAHVNIGNCYALILKDLKQAINHLEKAVALDPTDGEIRFNLGAILDATGDTERAIEEYGAAEKYGVERAKVNLKNAKIKLLAKKAKSDGTESK